jgi:hypothetical protein
MVNDLLVNDFGLDEEEEDDGFPKIKVDEDPDEEDLADVDEDEELVDLGILEDDEEEGI